MIIRAVCRLRDEVDLKPVELLCDARFRVCLQLEREQHIAMLAREVRRGEAAPREFAAQFGHLGAGHEDVELIAFAIVRVIVERRIGRERDARACRRLACAQRQDVAARLRRRLVGDMR